MAGQSWSTENIPKKMKGYLEIEDDELKFFTKRFFVLRRKKEILEYYREDPFAEPSAQKDGSINIKDITQVAVSTQRPKIPNCFEISVPAKKYYLSSHSRENMLDWVNSLHEAAVNPRERVRSEGDKDKKEVALDGSIGYHTSIIGGVVVKTPKEAEKSLQKQGGIKPLMEGWCFKQGAVMKSWKRRYFTLSVVKLCYFENKEDKEPIRSILSQDILGVRESPRYAGRENVLEMETPNRKFYIQSDNKEGMEAWKKAIHSVLNPSGSIGRR
ncbi:pleckstrin homology domain-containing family A member 1-like [Rhopilema esculentum]|uniref:pleckstrin homology domain-containing family A member 1-like n=1 Tax=Rhopilema esculentum TaxID=499914 RepID=UPI0031D01221